MLPREEISPTILPTCGDKVSFSVGISKLMVSTPMIANPAKKIQKRRRGKGV